MKIINLEREENNIKELKKELTMYNEIIFKFQIKFYTQQLANKKTHMRM